LIAFGLAVALAAVAGYGVASSVAPSTATLLPMPDIGDIQVGRNDAINTIEAQCAIIVGGFSPPLIRTKVGPYRDSIAPKTLTASSSRLTRGPSRP